MEWIKVRMSVCLMWESERMFEVSTSGWNTGVETFTPLVARVVGWLCHVPCVPGHCPAEEMKKTPEIWRMAATIEKTRRCDSKKCHYRLRVKQILTQLRLGNWYHHWTTESRSWTNKTFCRDMLIRCRYSCVKSFILWISWRGHRINLTLSHFE